MATDVAQLLRELDLTVTEGSRPGTWLLRGPNGERFEVLPRPPQEHLDARVIRNMVVHHTLKSSNLLVGRSATPTVIKRAEAGEFSILTAEPTRLIHAGTTYAVPESPSPPASPPHRGRPAWTRWAVMRYLLLARSPARQSAIADALGTSQQAVSNAVRVIGPLSEDSGDGFVATDRHRLLKSWLAEYPGPGGVEFGWYSLDPVVAQTMRAAESAATLELEPLIGGDVAADVLAPWKLPARGRIYVRGPIDLTDEGFVPSPLEEATLCISTPQDPTFWRLAGEHHTAVVPDATPLADPPFVLWDLQHSTDVDSAAAAEKLAELIEQRG